MAAARDRICTFCLKNLDKKHDFNLVSGKNNYKEDIQRFLNAVQDDGCDRCSKSGKNAEREPWSADLPRPYAVVLLLGTEYICKECLTLNKKWQSLKSKTEETENILKERLKCTTRRKSQEQEHSLRPTIISAPLAIKLTNNLNVVAPVNCALSSTPLKRRNQEEISMQLKFSPVKPIIPKAKKVLIIDSSSKSTIPPSRPKASGSDVPVNDSSSVVVQLNFRSETRKVKLKEELKSLGIMIARGTFKQIANAAMRHPRIREDILKIVLKEIDRECNSLCQAGSKKKPVDVSLLRKTSKEAITAFSFECLQKELKQRAPLFWKVLKVASLRPKDRANLERIKKEELKSKRTQLKNVKVGEAQSNSLVSKKTDEYLVLAQSIEKRTMHGPCMAVAVCLKNRSPRMTAVQLLVTLIIQHSGLMV